MLQKTVSFVSHSACRTGAPLALLHTLERIKNPHWQSNVLLLRDGPLKEAFAGVCPVDVVSPKELQAMRLAYHRHQKNSSLHGLMRGCMRKAQPDLYYLHSHSFDFLPLAAFYEVPVIFHIHEVPASFIQVDQELLSLFRTYPIRYVAASRYVQRMLIEDLGIDPQKITVVSSGVESDRWQPQAKDTALLSSLGIPHDALVIGASGKRIPLKGVDLWLQTARYLCDVFPEHNFHFVWVGEASDQVYDFLMQREAENLGLADRIHFVDEQSDPRPYYSLFDIGTVCSRTESLSLVCLEWTLMGKPVVACASAGGPQEFAEEGFIHVVKEPRPQLFAEAVEHLVQHPEEGMRMVSCGQEVIPRLYDVRNAASQMECVIADALREYSMCAQGV